MANVNVRNLPDEVHRAIRIQAAHHGRSTEAEIRLILEQAVRPKISIGSAIAAIGRSVGGVELDLRRDNTPVKPAELE